MAQEVNNKKQTTVVDLEIYQLDFDELTFYIQHKFFGSVIIDEIEFQRTLKCPKYMIKIQGN